MGNACIVRNGKDLLNFIPGNILITDQLGSILKSDISRNTRVDVINKLVTSPVFYTAKDMQIKDRGENKPTIIKTKKPFLNNVQTIFPEAENTIEIVVKMPSCGMLRGMGGTTFYDIPCLYSCIGLPNVFAITSKSSLIRRGGKFMTLLHFRHSKPKWATNCSLSAA